MYRDICFGEDVKMIPDQMLYKLTGVQFKKYKSFETKQTYEVPLTANLLLIIGRNNSGKSSVIDVVESALGNRQYLNQVQGITWSFVIDSDNLEKGYTKPNFKETPSRDYSYASQYLGKEIVLEKGSFGHFDIAKEQKEIDLNVSSVRTTKWNLVAQSYDKALDNICVRRLNAERDVVPELDNDQEDVSNNGSGATNLVRRFLLLDTYREQVVEQDILKELNTIMSGDGSFTNIRVQQIKDNEKGYKWEIFLEEGNDRFALSKSGSGLKTILLILINLYLVPKTQKYKGKEIVYAFEEIENNLHPALQRRVFEYLYKYSIEKNIKIIITTHSHIAINTFYGRDKVSISHILKKNAKSDILNIDSNQAKNHILDDLGVKASDMFQSNGIIWVEGPSDRIYILRWLSVFNDFHLTEGDDFQFMYYGGKLLSHFAIESEGKSDLIDILTTNRHAAIVIDSDKTYQSKPINDTKKRIKKEFDNNNLFCWITKGKEIENYLPAEAINHVHNSSLDQIERYCKFPDYIAKYDESFSLKKVEYARKYAEFITKDNSEDILDLQKKVQELYSVIRQW